MSSATKPTPEAEEKQPAALASVVRWMWRKASIVRWMWRLAAEHILWLLAAYGILAFVIYLILVTVGPLDGLRLSTQLALGQVVIGWVALSIAIPGGYFAVREFQAANARPELDLQYHLVEGAAGTTKEWPARRPPVGDTTTRVVKLVNQGDAAARWWQLTLTLGEGVSLDSALPKHPEDTANSDIRHSGGEKIAYPGLPVEIGKIVVTNTVPENVKIHYSIATDRSHVENDDLFIVLPGPPVAEAPAPEQSTEVPAEPSEEAEGEPKESA